MTKTPDQLIAEIKALMEQLADATGHRITDTKEPVFFGLPVTDARPVGDSVQVGIKTEVGWIVTKLDLAYASILAANIAAGVAASLNAMRGQAEAAQAPIH